MDVMDPHIWSHCETNCTSFYPYMPALPPRRCFWGSGRSHFGQFSRESDPSWGSVGTQGMCLTSPILQWMSWTLTYGPTVKRIALVSTHTCQLCLHAGASGAQAGLILDNFHVKLTQAGAV